MPGVRVWPWVGGTLDLADPEDAQWRSCFAGNVRALLEPHPRLAGVLNIEPLPDGSPGYLRLLEELKAALPSGRRLSIAAYPPPTRWQPSMEVHWSESYFRAVAQRSDHLAVMTYDTGLRYPKFYRKLMHDWTREILTWADGQPVLIGIPAYEDADTTYHKPDVENLEHALAGMQAGLDSFPVLPANYRGISLYCDWVMNASNLAGGLTAVRAEAASDCHKRRTMKPGGQPPKIEVPSRFYCRDSLRLMAPGLCLIDDLHALPLAARMFALIASKLMTSSGCCR